MKSHFGISHFSFNFTLWRKGSYRVNNYNVNSTRAYKIICDLKRLFSIVRLGDDKVFKIYSKVFSIKPVKSMFSIYKSRNSSCLLSLGNCMKGKSSFTRRLGTIYFYYSPSWITSCSQCYIKTQRTRRDGFNV